MEILVLGVTGRVGSATAKALATRGHVVRGFSRRKPEDFVSELWISGDAMREADVLHAARGCAAVVNCIGSSTIKMNTVESETTEVVLRAVKISGVRRYIAISAGLVIPLGNPIFDWIILPLILKNLKREHLVVERLVKASDLDWTIARPSRITDDPLRGYVAGLDPKVRTISTSRADVAAFIADELERNEFIREAPFIGRRGPK